AVEAIVADAAVEMVDPSLAENRVVALVAEEAVVAAQTVDRIVECRTADLIGLLGAFEVVAGGRVNKVVRNLGWVRGRRAGQGEGQAGGGEPDGHVRLLQFGGW